jgi:hypothetical protein
MCQIMPDTEEEEAAAKARQLTLNAEEQAAARHS